FHGDEAFARHFGVASDTLRRSLLGCREEARDTAEAILSLAHHVPMGTDSCGPLCGCHGNSPRA
ncbi:hypothetical protein M9458_013190, partial [Cirrhinus mrigala]